MGQGGLLGKLFRRKDTEVGSPPEKSSAPTPEGTPRKGSRPTSGAPRLRIEDAVPLRPVVTAVTTSWDEDETLRYILGSAADAPAVSQVLDLCDTLQGPTPPGLWREQMAALLADNAAGISALRTIALRETPFDDAAANANADHRAPFVRSVVWAIGVTEPADAVPLLIHLTDLYGKPGRGREYRSVAVTAVEALGWIGGERALPALRQIRAEAKLSAVRQAASRELDQTLGEAHLSRADVPEWQAETFELGRDGQRVVELAHGTTVTIQLEADGEVTLVYRDPTGRQLTGQPPGGRTADSIREASDIAENLRTVVYSERFRLKQLMKDQRTLTHEDWTEFYIGNPVTGRLCRALVWESSIDGGENWHRFVPIWSTRREAWLRLGEDGVSHDFAEESQTRLVDPKNITAAETRDWAAQLRKLRLRQPFKQLDMPRGENRRPRNHR